jgi:hypothetical protein
MNEVGQRRMSWKDFLHLHASLKFLHPRQWEINWAKLPKTIEKDSTGMPVYLKAGRTHAAACVLVHKEEKLVARRYSTGYWETFQYGLAGQLVRYENSLGADVRQYWMMPFDIFPTEIHTGFRRWIQIHALGERTLYWCAFTGMFKDGDVEFSRDNLGYYFEDPRWTSRDDRDEVYQKAFSMPSTKLGRRLWCLTRRDPSQGEEL